MNNHSFCIMEKRLLFTITQAEFETLLKCCIIEVLNEISKETAASKTDLPELLTPKQTADFLGISKVTLWKWTKAGKIKSCQIGFPVRYKREEVLRALSEIKNKR